MQNYWRKKEILIINRVKIGEINAISEVPQIKWIDKESKQWKKDKDRIKVTLNDISWIMKALFKVKKNFECKYIQEMALSINFCLISCLYLFHLEILEMAFTFQFSTYLFLHYLFINIHIGIYYRLLRNIYSIFRPYYLNCW